MSTFKKRGNILFVTEILNENDNTITLRQGVLMSKHKKIDVLSFSFKISITKNNILLGLARK